MLSFLPWPLEHQILESDGKNPLKLTNVLPRANREQPYSLFHEWIGIDVPFKKKKTHDEPTL